MHLYWGKYPYKVQIRLFVKEGAVVWARTYGKNVSIDRRNYEVLKSEIYYFVPPDHGNWKLTEKWNYIYGCNMMSFFFMLKSDADHFMKNNQERVRAAYALRDDIDPKVFENLPGPVRDTLYFQRYRYSVEFKKLDHIERNEIDKWVAEIFGDDPEVSRYSGVGARVLYLKNENDILLVQLAFSTYISRVQTITLRSEITDGRIFS